jgi:hypothetical protein
MIITLNIIKKAMQHKMRMDEENARKNAETVLNFFGFQDRILDNSLEPVERQLFYELENEGILNSERESVNLSNGNEWRLHYWLINKKRILEYGQENKISHKKIKTEKHAARSIYDTITETMWNKRKITE